MKINREFEEVDFLLCLNGMSGGFRTGRDAGRAAPAADYEKATRHLSTRLRSLVDEWLDSARSKNDCEDPHKRLPGPFGKAALAEFWSSNKVTQYIGEDGELELIFPPERRTLSAEGKEDPVADSEHEALRLFSCFMVEPRLKERFAKCRKCGIYYCTLRKLADIYMKGTYCESCRSQVTAKRSQSDRRSKWKNKILTLAAKIWPLWKSRAQQGERSAWVAERVNKKLAWHEQRIRKNWVTRNEGEILEKARESGA
jgi:hypothetical protein